LIEALAAESQQVCFEKILYRFPQPHELAKILNGLAPGAIIDLHDCWPRHTSTEADRTPTVEALRIALPEMGARGYRSVTVSELLAAAPVAPG
jgi:hypothetical protein